jgi:hypothetical protein
MTNECLLRLSVLYYARKRMQALTYGDSKQHSTTLEQTKDCRTTSTSQQDEPMESS